MWLVAIALTVSTAVVYFAQAYRFQGHGWADEVCGLVAGSCETPQYFIFASGLVIAIAVLLRLKRTLRDS